MEEGLELDLDPHGRIEVSWDGFEVGKGEKLLTLMVLAHSFHCVPELLPHLLQFYKKKRNMLVGFCFFFEPNFHLMDFSNRSL